MRIKSSGRGCPGHLIALEPLNCLQVWLHEPTDQMSMAAHQMAEKLSIFFEHVKHPQIKTPSVVELYVITRMVLGLTRYASLEKSSLLDSPLLKETISKMVFALLEK